ncbi:MAG: chemotaxis protein CheC [Lentisphaeraceae bacterium]|nr:chemotaxis protein CheC [Lentisphaeraceae bacterium]
MIELNKFHTDALCECMNVGVGQAAAVLSELVGQSIELSVPSMNVIQLDSIRSFLDQFYGTWHSCAALNFNSNFSGDAILVFTEQSAKGWTELISLHQFAGMDIELTSDMENDFLLEIGNNLINGCVGSIANFIGTECDFSIPILHNRITGDIYDDVLDSKSSRIGLVITTSLTAEERQVSTDLFLALDAASLDVFIEAVNRILEN